MKLFSKYSFKGGALSGLGLSGGFVYTNSVDEGVLSGLAPTLTSNRSNAIIPSSTFWEVGANRWRDGWSCGVKLDNVTNLRYYIPSASRNTRALFGLPRVVSFDVTRKFGPVGLCRSARMVNDAAAGGPLMKLNPAAFLLLLRSVVAASAADSAPPGKAKVVASA